MKNAGYMLQLAGLDLCDWQMSSSVLVLTDEQQVVE